MCGVSAIHSGPLLIQTGSFISLKKCASFELRRFYGKTKIKKPGFLVRINCAGVRNKSKHLQGCLYPETTKTIKELVFGEGKEWTKIKSNFRENNGESHRISRCSFPQVVKTCWAWSTRDTLPDYPDLRDFLQPKCFKLACGCTCFSFRSAPLGPNPGLGMGEALHQSLPRAKQETETSCQKDMHTSKDRQQAVHVCALECSQAWLEQIFHNSLKMPAHSSEALIGWHRASRYLERELGNLDSQALVCTVLLWDSHILFTDRYSLDKSCTNKCRCGEIFLAWSNFVTSLSWQAGYLWSNWFLQRIWHERNAHQRDPP